MILELGDAVLKRRRWNQSLYDKLTSTTLLLELGQYITPNTTTIDVGGNTGYQTFWHSQYNNVITYEPVPPLFEILKQNMKNQNVPDDRVDFRNLAVGNKDCDIELHVDINRLSMTSQIPLVESQCIHVPMVKLDSEDHENIGFIKIDVEGFELEVVKGAEEIILRDRPHCMVEIYQPWCEKTKSESQYYFDWFFSRDYACFYFDCQNKSFVKVRNIAEGVKAVKEDHEKHDADFLFIHQDKKMPL